MDRSSEQIPPDEESTHPIDGDAVKLLIANQAVFKGFLRRRLLSFGLILVIGFLLLVSLVCALFLWHLRSALVAVITLPLGVLVALAGYAVSGVGDARLSGGLAGLAGVDTRRPPDGRSLTRGTLVP